MKKHIISIVKNNGSISMAKAGNIMTYKADVSFVGLGNYNQSKFIPGESYQSQITVYSSLISAFDVVLSLNSPDITNDGDSVFENEGM